ncbi:hybrid sensor histidine kinase/response regulator transcription factor [Flammeovirga pacifica]|uniref:histidine kinase n=1 Tax=Flammeovirga pacifica TaxID=915059 RepID=A0A1S1YTU6_FLAPC|nr:hybrid sensor histidine kinase/response regulator transcription factor [Flammeovirga pacifica]OHX64436.1 hypothetical protein NH26_22885 [Flammeovirga pacifica]
MKRILHTLLLVLLVTINGFTQNSLDHRLLKTYSMPEGLSHYGVTSLLEDHNGLLWVGTFDGLNTFDGFEFKTYRNIKNLNSNRVRTLFQDERQNIWLGTDHGVSLFDYDTQKFESIYLQRTKQGVKSGPIVRQIQYFNEDVLCTTEEEGLLFFDENNKGLIDRISFDEGVLAYQTIVLNENEVLTTTSNGVYLIDVNEKTKTIIGNTKADKILEIAKYDDNTIITVRNRGLGLIYKKKNGEWSDQKKVFKHDKFQTIHIDHEHHIWLGHKEIGLYQLSIDQLKNDQLPEVLYSIYRVGVILSNSDGNYWVGSLRKGLYQLPLHQNVFHYSDLGNQERSKEWSNHVLNVQVLDTTNVLLNVHFRGILNFNTKTNKLEPLPKSLQKLKGLSNATIFIDREGGQFVKSYASNGKNLYLPKGMNHWVDLKYKGLPELISAKLKSITLDQFGYHWLATQEGLFRLKFGTYGQIKSAEFINQYPALTAKKIIDLRYIYEDPKYNFIWVGTKSDGLIRINNQPKKSLVKMKKSLFVHDPNNKYSVSSNFISAITRLDNGQLWLGTEGGGICLVENTRLASTFKAFKEKDGLDNNVVKSIQSEGNNRLWITTNRGLNEFDLKSHKFRNYTEDDGVLISPFEPSSTVLENGKMIFAGGNGLCYFNPSEVVDDVPMPKFILGDFKVFNQKIAPLDTLNKRVILTKSLDQTKEIELEYDENVFSIELISLHYSNSKGNLVKYRMLPQDKEWVTAPSELKYANFNGLPPGEYVFQAAVSNSKKDWSAIKEIKITIHPPIWKTNWAYFIYVVLILIILYIIGRFVLRLNNLSHDLELEHIERERVDQLNKTRTRLFMNIAHEFRTPLTLISGPLQVLVNMFEENNDANKHLSLIERQAKKMFQLVNQVQDFQKAEQSLLKLKMSSFDFTDLISEVKKGFDQLAEHSSKKFEVVGEANQIFAVADRQKLEIVLNNLLNNAFKFTNKEGTITLQYAIKDEQLYFSVSDNGVGIKDKDLPFVFDRYYQSDDVNTATIGSGIGLAFSKRIVELHYGNINVSSEQGKGTIFEVMLPVEVSLEDTFNEGRLQEILSLETDDEKQRLHPMGVELPESLKDETLKELSVYYVEDNDDLRDFVSTSLSEYFNVKSFVHGKQCMDAVEHEWPDLIISDILMPEMNGLELCKLIKADVRTSHIPVVLLTSRSSVDDQVLGLESGADAYISKPFDLKHLIATTQMLLKNRKQLRERFRIDFPVEVEKKNNNKSDRVFMEKLYGLMEKHLDDEELDINIFIKELHLNRTHFYQKVKSITNHTPYELLKLYRLKKAAEFLVKEKLTVTEVYMRTGFKSRTHFSRMFKEHYGITPGKYGKEEVVVETSE